MDDLWESEHRGLTLNTLKIYYFLSFSWFYAVFLVSPTVGLRPEKHYRRAGHSNSRWVSWKNLPSWRRARCGQNTLSLDGPADYTPIIYILEILYPEKVATNIRLRIYFYLLYLHYTFLLRLVDKVSEWITENASHQTWKVNIIRYFTGEDGRRRAYILDNITCKVRKGE